MQRLLIRDTDGKKSLTATLFALSFLVATFKLLVSELYIGGYKFPLFSGGDFAAVVGAAGVIYGYRRSNVGNGTTNTAPKRTDPLD